MKTWLSLVLVTFLTLFLVGCINFNELIGGQYNWSETAGIEKIDTKFHFGKTGTGVLVADASYLKTNKKIINEVYVGSFSKEVKEDFFREELPCVNDDDSFICSYYVLYYSSVESDYTNPYIKYYYSFTYKFIGYSVISQVEVISIDDCHINVPATGRQDGNNWNCFSNGKSDLHEKIDSYFKEKNDE